MYQPVQFREDNLETQQALIRAHPLGLLITAGNGGLLANSVPFHLDRKASSKGTLQLHLARANPQWQEIRDGAPVLAVFQGSNAYVTPSWYPTKQEHGKVVPTWNYAVVQARGTARIIDDPQWLLNQIKALTTHHEAGRAEPWGVDDAPEKFIAMQLRAIVGIKIEIEAIEGKWKVSQNRSIDDREGVAHGLERESENPDMLALVKHYGGLSASQFPKG